jgi:hypothetical protein
MTTEPEQLLTDNELESISDHLTGFAEHGEIEGLIDDVPALQRLLAERNQLLHDVLWYGSEFGVEHWRDCDDEDCYLCDGHTAVRDRWRGAGTLDRDGEGQA